MPLTPGFTALIIILGVPRNQLINDRGYIQYIVIIFSHLKRPHKYGGIMRLL